MNLTEQLSLKKSRTEALQAKNEKTRRVTQAEAAAAEKLAAEAEAFQISINPKLEQML